MAPTLTATYTHPTAPTKTFTHALPASPSTSTPEKTAHLSALRHAATQLQTEINEFLTAKMEDEKAGAATAGAEMHGGPAAPSGPGGDEEREKEEEEAYGEERVEE